jgi:hypothetical protein
MRINEIITKKSGAGTVTTVGGNEISRSTPKIGGSQTTQYADGSIKNTFNTNVGGANTDITKVNGISTNMDIGSGTVRTKNNVVGNKLKTTQFSYDLPAGKGTLVAQPGKISIRK